VHPYPTFVKKTLKPILGVTRGSRGFKRVQEDSRGFNVAKALFYCSLTFLFIDPKFKLGPNDPSVQNSPFIQIST
jgi:hypothetical protein